LAITRPEEKPGRVDVQKFLAGAMVCAFLLGCGDAETTDRRGYTKAPLEKPQLLIEPEGTSAMDSLGTPILPRDTVIPPPTQTGN
jgi:hypothetical protein